VGHKADKSFFLRKREWSKRKDEILRCYLPPYLRKVAKLGRPIFIVDAFAGRGMFEDGTPGSPVIICQCVKAALDKGLSVTVSVVCVEPNEELFAGLKKTISEFSFATPRQGRFQECITDFEKQARDHSTFLYVDPWTVEGLKWRYLDRIFQHLTNSGTSIEILLNFQADIFARMGLSALRLATPELDPGVGDSDEIDAPMAESPSIERLNDFAGGNWWQQILQSSIDYPGKLQRLTNGICEQLKGRFREVCQHAIKAKPHHTVPKYFLIFASRHPDALRLMNDQMVKSRNALAELAKPKEPTLFETRSTDLVPDADRLSSLIPKHCAQPTRRRDVILNVIRENFCEYSVRQIRGYIETMLKDGRLTSETGRAKINDNTKIHVAARPCRPRN